MRRFSNGVVKYLRRAIYGVLALVGAALIQHLAVQGELPAWIMKAFGWLVSFFSLTTPWAIWELLLPIALVGGVNMYLLTRAGRLVDKLESKSDKLEQDLYVARSDNAKLVAENKALRSLPNEQSSLSVLTTRQHKVMMAVAGCENGDSISTIENLLAATGLSRVDVMSCLDDLADLQYVQRIRMGWIFKYQLTSIGRKYVIRDSHVTMD